MIPIVPTDPEPLAFADVRELESRHARVLVVSPDGGPLRYLQPVLWPQKYDKPALCVILSSDAVSHVVDLEESEVGLYQRAGDFEVTGPVNLRKGERVIRSRDGHDGMAEAVAVCAEWFLPVRFNYQKQGKVQTEARHIRVGFARGPMFGGSDYMRDLQRRQFRIDRVVELWVAEHTHGYPVFTEVDGWHLGA